MGMNRAQRRKQERDQLREWRTSGKAKQIMTLQKNGITEADLNNAYKDGYKEGYMYAAEGFMKKMYAAVAKELIENGSDKDAVVEFVKNVDHRFAVMFDADEEIADVYNMIGINFNIDRNAIRRVE
jgi:hypothetical protein